MEVLPRMRVIPNEGHKPSKMFRMQIVFLPSRTDSEVDVYRGTSLFHTYTVRKKILDTNILFEVLVVSRVFEVTTSVDEGLGTI